jgi:small ligand-binding sensory domain FIST
MGKDEAQGGVTIQSEVSDGTELWIVRRDKELIACGMQAISRQIREQMADKRPKFVLQFECVGRGKVVFREREKVELIRALQREVGEGIPWIGLYTYGEIGPVVRNNCFHNFTSVVAAVY